MNQILSADSKNMIGRDNDLLVYIPEDLKYFKEKTINNTIIVGRKTLESFPNGKPLPNRKNIVLSRDKNYKVDGATVYNSVEELLENIDVNDDSVFVAGGGKIYELLIDYCDKIYLTMIDKDLDGNVSYIDYKAEGFVKVIEDVQLKHNDFTYRHSVWVRK